MFLLEAMGLDLWLHVRELNWRNGDLGEWTLLCSSSTVVSSFSFLVLLSISNIHLTWGEEF